MLIMAPLILFNHGFNFILSMYYLGIHLRILNLKVYTYVGLSLSCLSEFGIDFEIE